MSLDIFKTINGSTIKEDFENTYIDYLEEKFEDSPNYKLVTKNFGNTNYKSLIVEYDTSKNLVGYKRLVSYPYTTQNFEVGDYVTFSYGGVSSDWLIFAIDKQFDYNLNGKIKKCNNTLKWKDDDGNLRSYPIVVDDKINNSDLNQNKHIIIPEGGIIVYCQQNEYTTLLDINKRFILSSRAYKINQIINYSSDSFMTLVMQYDNIDVNDDLVNNIANNDLNEYTLTINQDDFTQQIGYISSLTASIESSDEIVSKNVEWISNDSSKVTINSSTGVFELLSNGSAIITCRMVDNINVSDSIIITVSNVLPSDSETIISPNEYTILQGQSETYSIYKYIDDVQQADTFSIVASNVPTTYFNISTTGNSFTVDNIKSYTTNDLLITCTNNVTSEITYKSIKLKGYW